VSESSGSSSSGSSFGERLRSNPRLLLTGGGALIVLIVAAVLAVSLGGNSDSLTVYSGRSAELIGPLLDRFEKESGIELNVRYAGSTDMAATLLEEGDRSPADVFISQDAGALGVVEDAGLFAPLRADVLGLVPPQYRSATGHWVGISGRVRTVVYNTDRLTPEDLPSSILDFTDPKWKGRLGWAPTNASFQAFVTALRVTLGEDGAREWLEAMKANDIAEFPNNVTIVEATARGEIDAGFVNHYYLFQYLDEQGEGFKARNYYTAPGDVGTLVNVAGGGILASSGHADEAAQLLAFLLSEESQRYFVEETHEYALVEGIPSDLDLQSIRELQPLEIDLSQLHDLQGTLALLRETGVLP